jgi:colanic acid biosynthesis glycosyl transferase WcaI
VKILAINQFYLPDHSASSQLLGELCGCLSATGHEVTVVASRGAYFGGIRFPPQEMCDGVRVVRPWATSLGKESILRRLSDYGSFWASSVAAAARIARPDVILVLSTPPLLAAGAALVGVSRRVPLVTWVHDVYPEVAAAFGLLSDKSMTYRALASVAAVTYQSASRVVALSEGMAARLIAQGAPRERVTVIPNWADGRLISPIKREENEFRAAHRLSDFVVMYSGNLGVGHEVDTLLEAARLLWTRKAPATFVFVGGGARRADAERAASELPNVRFLPYQPREALAQSLTAADVHLISLREGNQGLLVPSKLYGALASGRPILYVGPDACEVAQVVRRDGLGWEGRPGDAAGLANAILRMHADSERTARIGAKARQVFEQNYDLVHARRRWSEVLEMARQDPALPQMLGRAMRSGRRMIKRHPATERL